MVLETHLSSDISTDPLVTSIAEELTNIINTINNYRTDWYNILTNLLKIKNIVEESENPQNISTLKSKLEEIQTILNEATHNCIEKILTKTQKLTNDIILEELITENTEKNNEDDDIINQCMKDLTLASEHVKKEIPVTYIDNKECKVRLHLTPKWEYIHRFVSESEVIIVNYSRIRFERSKLSVVKKTDSTPWRTSALMLEERLDSQMKTTVNDMKPVLRQVLLKSQTTQTDRPMNETVIIDETNTKTHKRRENSKSVTKKSRTPLKQYKEFQKHPTQDLWILDMRNHSHKTEMRNKSQRKECTYNVVQNRRKPKEIALCTSETKMFNKLKKFHKTNGHTAGADINKLKCCCAPIQKDKEKQFKQLNELNLKEKRKPILQIVDSILIDKSVYGQFLKENIELNSKGHIDDGYCNIM